jgi:hypothetical protein
MTSPTESSLPPPICFPPPPSLSSPARSLDHERWLAHLSWVDDGLLRHEIGFLSRDASEISLQRSSGAVLGSKNLDSNLDLKSGANLTEFGVKICLGPRHTAHLPILPHRVPLATHVCGVVRPLGSTEAAMVDRPRPSQVLSSTFPPDRRERFPQTLIRLNPRSRSATGDLARVVFVPADPPPRSRSPSPADPKIWQGTFGGDFRSFAQVLVSSPRMDRRFGGSRRSPGRRSPPRNYFGP